MKYISSTILMIVVIAISLTGCGNVNMDIHDNNTTITDSANGNDLATGNNTINTSTTTENNNSKQKSSDISPEKLIFRKVLPKNMLSLSSPIDINTSDTVTIVKKNDGTKVSYYNLYLDDKNYLAIKADNFEDMFVTWRHFSNNHSDAFKAPLHNVLELRPFYSAAGGVSSVRWKELSDNFYGSLFRLGWGEVTPSNKQWSISSQIYNRSSYSSIMFIVTNKTTGKLFTVCASKSSKWLVDLNSRPIPYVDASASFTKMEFDIRVHEQLFEEVPPISDMEYEAGNSRAQVIIDWLIEQFEQM